MERNRFYKRFKNDPTKWRMKYNIEKKLGYDWEPYDIDSVVLRTELLNFQIKLNSYLGDGPLYKKMKGEKKWDQSMKHDIEFKKNPIKAKWERVDRILRLKQLATLFSLNKNRNRY